MEIKKYGRRNWALYDHAGNLICVTVYKKGAQEVAKLLAATLGRRKTVRRNPADKAQRFDWVIVGVKGQQRGYFTGDYMKLDTSLARAARFLSEMNTRSIIRLMTTGPLSADPGWKFTAKKLLRTVQKNPVPPSSKARLNAAAKLYEDFTGHSPEFIDRVSVPDVDTAFAIGDAEGVLYSCVRDGKREKYIHEFKSKARPLLCSSYDGRQLLLLGGGFQFTERGIVDD